MVWQYLLAHLVGIGACVAFGVLAVRVGRHVIWKRRR